MAGIVVLFSTKQLKETLYCGQYMISKLIGNIEKLIDDVTEVTAYLGDAASTLHAEQLREMNLERQLKQVTYDIVDTIESSSHRMLVAMDKSVLFRKELIEELGEAQERAIESIRSRRLEPITRWIKAYKALGIHSAITNQIPSEHLNKKVQPPAPMKFVGLEDDAQTLINYLLKETEGLDVIAITGMPGVGKTTMASKIFHDNSIREKFPTLLWVDGFLSLKEFCFDILKQCKNSGSQDSSLGNLNNSQVMEDAVRDSLKKGKYLLIMDGVWDAQSLKEVEHILPEMGKVLITSRNNRITTKPHVLRFMTEKESWELLQWEVFGELGKCPEMLKSTGECIARNCDGLPLAIAAAGNSLVGSSSTEAANSLTEKWWKAVSENVIMHVTDYGDQLRVLERLESSYSKLTPRMQECFLYLGVFPEGHEVRVKTLVRLWIAEGLLHDLAQILKKYAMHILGETEVKDLQSLEETAEEYLHDLIDRNLVVVVKRYTDGHIKTCRLHKLIYAFCKYKAVEKDFYQGIGDGPISLSPDNHRLCIYSNIPEFLSSKPKECHLRSILCFKEEEKVVLSRKKSSKIHKWFKLLRVLECRCVNFTSFPYELNMLIHLRYISLSCDEIDSIPKAISRLRYLETLIVDTKSSSLQFHRIIWKMIQLRHLVTKAAIIVHTPREGEVARYLRTLNRLAPSCCTKDVFGGSPNLKTLGIRGPLATLTEPESLIELKHLENLKLRNEPAVDCQLHLNCFPPTLKRLTLSGTCLKWESANILGKIDSLEILKLKNNAFVGDSWISSDADGFRCLSFLLIATTDLASWEVSSPCFPNLKHLVLNDCEKLDKIPSVLAKSLNKVDLDKVSESAAASARKIEQEIARREGLNKMQ